MLERNLRRERLSRGDLETAARLQQVASIDEIQWAILERNGQISVIQKRAEN